MLGGERPRAALTALRLVWITYFGCVLAMVGVACLSGAPAVFSTHGLQHVVGLVVACGLRADRAHSRLAWSLFTAIGLPTVFSAVGLALPAMHPQPYEWACIAFDRWLFGFDPTVAAQRWLTPWLVEALQLAYASFYLLPLLVLVTLLRQRRHAEYDACLCAVGLGFLLSYLGYYLLPTLPPYRYFEHGVPVPGLWLAESVHALLDALEANRFDCMPSGHTMLTLMTMALAWRYTPRLLFVLLPIGALLLVATVALRYHYVADVLAGALLAAVALWLARWLTRACARTSS